MMGLELDYLSQRMSSEPYRTSLCMSEKFVPGDRFCSKWLRRPEINHRTIPLEVFWVEHCPEWWPRGHVLGCLPTWGLQHLRVLLGPFGRPPFQQPALGKMLQSRPWCPRQKVRQKYIPLSRKSEPRRGTNITTICVKNVNPEPKSRSKTRTVHQKVGRSRRISRGVKNTYP